jgi:hypothetical protein
MINSLLGLLAAGLLSLFGKSPRKPVADDLNRADFKTSTQRLGIRFSEKIRDVFRFRWIKAAHNNDAGHTRRSQQSEESSSRK